MPNLVGCFSYTSNNELKELIHQANKNQKIKIIEIRVDYLPEGSFDPKLIHEIQSLSNKPLIITIRSPKEGGKYPYSIDGQISIYQTALLYNIHYIDLELAQINQILPNLENSSQITQIIASWHGKINKNPHDQIPNDFLRFMKKFQAIPAQWKSILKIVINCSNPVDASRVEQLQLALWNRYPSLRISIFGTGNFSQLSRILGHEFGNSLTYVGLRKDLITADAQPDLSRFLREYRIFLSMKLGKSMSVYTFGSSHGYNIGCIIHNFPNNFDFKPEQIQNMLNRRRPGHHPLASKREEGDQFQITNGVQHNRVTDDFVRMEIRNRDTKAKDYEKFKCIPRPSHIDYPVQLRYDGSLDITGSGIFSGRMTAPYVFAGALAIQFFEQQNIQLRAYIQQIGSIYDSQVYTPKEIISLSDNLYIPNPSSEMVAQMEREIQNAQDDHDSVGGKIAVIVVNFPKGIGDPWFHSLESRLSQAILGIPGIRGIEFGTGMKAAKMRGSLHNDPYILEDGEITTKTNHAGGIVGGISLGTPIRFQIGIKPTASIGKPQSTLNICTRKQNHLIISGRHDPCIVPRMVPVIEAITAIVLLDAWNDQKN